MSRVHSEIICEKMIDEIMNKGDQMSKDNNTIKKHYKSHVTK